ncbi:MAG: discoidin domain-containing protein, partial [Phycisphaeraceae bacterium]|nr:discoidin domain-containing protein [Phycisphaeraceae bacterium]
MCRRMVYCVCVAILLGTAVVQAGYDRVAYWDDAYPTHWIVEGETIEIRDAAEAAGYRIIGADELKTWMDGHIADGKLSVLIMCKDVFPVTVVESRDDQATVRRYLEAGGKIVFHGDIPFYNVGNADGTETNWGDGGATDILGFNTSSAGRDSSNTVSFTDIGLEWGLTGTWASLRPAAPDITENLTILATDDDGDAAAWVKHFMPGDTFRGFVRVWDRTSIATIADLFAVAEYGAVPGLAADDYPADGSDDILRDVVLQWIPGEFAGTHNVYFGGSFEDANGATVATSSGQNANSLDVGRLDFGQTYFWRVDEVNATPDKTVYKGDIWSFTVEPYAIQIPASSIAVTASSIANDFSPPEKTIDGSGLGADNAHSISSEHMWFTAAVDLDPWIQYEFDAVQKLDIMRVWNSNSSAEMAIGWGIKDVEIAYSVDGDTWDVLEGATQFSRGTASPTYNAYDTIAFGGVPAKYVRFNIASNWGGILMSYSLSEVQFDMIPAQARTPEPADGATGVVPNAVVAWRAGREAGQHTIYVSADQGAVADGSAPSLTSNTNSVDLSSLDLGMGTVYYLRVDEVNETEAVSTWAGPVWSFTTTAAVVVEDFESYNNMSPDRPFQSWLDGFGYSSDEFFPTAYGGNGTGAGIGHDIWSLSSPYYDGDIMETSNTIAGSGQA